MHAVILAAGKNERLKSVVAPYHKPLVDVGGEPLLVTLVDLAEKHCDRVVVVASVENVSEVRDLIGDNPSVRIVIQPKAIGPGDALLRGVEACDDDKVMVLCGDNVINAATLRTMVDAAGRHNGFVVGTTLVKEEADAVRYTRITRNGNFVEGPVEDAPHPNGWVCWLGPIIATRSNLDAALRLGRDEYSYFRIGIHLNTLLKRAACKTVMLTGVTDIGTPADLAEVQSA